MDGKKIVEQYLKIAPYLGAAGTGAAIGGAVSDDRKKGAMKGALIGLGSLVGGRLAAKGGSSIANRFLGKDKLKFANEFRELEKKIGTDAAIHKVNIDALVANGKVDAANTYISKLQTEGLGAAYASLGENHKYIPEIPKDMFAKLLSKESGIIGGAATIGSSAGLAGTAYALRNGNSSKK